MLGFYRRHAVKIALSIVIFFVGTMFTGVVLFGRLFWCSRPA